MGWRRANEVLAGGTVWLPVLPSLAVTGKSVGALLGLDPDIQRVSSQAPYAAAPHPA